MQETSPGPMAGKADWRRWLRGILAAVDNQEAQSHDIRQQLGAHLDDESRCCIAIFSPLPGEPDLLELVTTLSAHRWVFPRVIGADLVFHQVDHLDQLQRGAFGISEPGSEFPIVPTTDIDIFLCPGLGFDRSGIRLGRGKGFYDRALSRAQQNAQRIGIAFREQVVERLPSDPHDIPMNLIITSLGTSPVL